MSIAIQILEEQMFLWEFGKTTYDKLKSARDDCMELMDLDDFASLVRSIRIQILSWRLGYGF